MFYLGPKLTPKTKEIACAGHLPPQTVSPPEEIVGASSACRGPRLAPSNGTPEGTHPERWSTVCTPHSLKHKNKQSSSSVVWVGCAQGGLGLSNHGVVHTTSATGEQSVFTYTLWPAAFHTRVAAEIFDLTPR